MKGLKGVLVLAFVGAAAGTLFADGMAGMDMGGMNMPAATPKTTVKSAAQKPKKVKAGAKAVKKHQRWVCPMHDGGWSDHPGKCPNCGMDMVLETDQDTPPAKP